MGRRSFVLAITVAVLTPALATKAGWAETKRPTGSSISTKTCDQKHSACISYCIGAKQDGDELKVCTEGCAGEWLRCKRTSAREIAPITETPTMNTVK